MMQAEQLQSEVVTPNEDEMVVILSKFGQLNHRDKSAINSHSARKGHLTRRRRKSEQQSPEQQQRRPLLQTRLIHPRLPQGNNTPILPIRCPTHDSTQLEECIQCCCSAEATTSLTFEVPASHRGNSDPFNTQPVQIDARVNFYVDVGFQCLDKVVWRSGLRVWCPPRGCVAPTARFSNPDVGFHLYGRHFASVTTPVKSEWESTYANAILAYSASALFAVTGALEHSTCATKYISRCITGLRHYITERSSHASFQPEQLILRLIRAEILAQNFSSAMIHAKYFKELVVAKFCEGKLEIGFVHHAVYQTNNLAFALWKRPAFEARWVEKVYVVDWAPLTINDHESTVFEERLKRFTHQISLQKLLTATKILFSQTASCLSGETIAPTDKWYWLNARSEWLQIGLLNFVHDQEAKVNSYPGMTTTAAADVNLCLALTAILSIRFQKHEPILNQVTISPASRIILSKLWATSTRLESCLTQNEVAQFSHALLWIAFIAAIVEHRLRASLSRNGQPDRRWWQRLVEMIVGQRICTWDEMHQSLTLFPYSEDETPLPSPNWLDGLFELAKGVKRLL